MYQALYRKWRPKTFGDVVAQNHITDVLRAQVRDGRLSHAYLFVGTRGTGKTTCARIFAKAVNCLNPQDGEPCGVCSACRSVEDGDSIDIVEIDAASNSKVDDIRQLRGEAIFSPTVLKKRIYIIDEVHNLSPQAFNALLKIIEEPPEYLIFILATTELQKVPVTILSRCQRHSFRRIDVPSIVSRLEYIAEKENIALEHDAALLLARLADGGMRDAISLLDQCSGRGRIDVDAVYSALGLSGRYNSVKLMELAAKHDVGGALALFTQLWNCGKDPAALLGELSSLLRDVLIKCVAPKNGQELLSGGFDDDSLDMLGRAFSEGALMNFLALIRQALSDMRYGQAKTTAELCIISLCHPDLGDGLPQLRERVAALERAAASGAPLPVQSPVQPPIEPVKSGAVPSHASASGAPAEAPANEPVEPVRREDVPFDLEPASPPPEVEAAVQDDAAAPHVSENGGEQNELEYVMANISRHIPGGLGAIMTDPTQCRATLEGDILHLELKAGFAFNTLGRPRDAEAVGKAASAILGRPITVRTAAVESEPRPVGSDGDDKLEQLKKFDIVKFE